MTVLQGWGESRRGCAAGGATLPRGAYAYVTARPGNFTGRPWPCAGGSMVRRRNTATPVAGAAVAPPRAAAHRKARGTRRGAGSVVAHRVLEIAQELPVQLDLAFQVALGVGVQDLEVELQVRVHLVVQVQAHVAVLLVELVGGPQRGAVLQVQRGLQLQRAAAAVLLLAVVEVQPRMQALDHELDLRIAMRIGAQ